MNKPQTARSITNEDTATTTSIAPSNTPLTHYVAVEDHEKLEEYSDYQEQQIKELEKLCIHIYQSDTARWWMKYKINGKFPKLVKTLNNVL